MFHSEAVELLIDMLEDFDGGDWDSARKSWDTALTSQIDSDDLVWIWGFFDSRQRAYLKRADRKYLDDYDARP